LLQAAPNLEDFKYVYHLNPKNSLLKFMAKHNPKLKKVYFFGDDGNDGDDGNNPEYTTFSDECILKFMSKVKLEEASFFHSGSISGELFGNIGNCATQLQVLRVQRISNNGDLVPQYDNVLFGGGVMHNLTELNISGEWVDLGEDFVDSVITCMPNIKNLYISEDEEKLLDNLLYVKLINHYDLEILSFKLYTNNEYEELAQAIGSKKNLKKLHLNNFSSSFSIEKLNNIYWPHMTSITIGLPDQITQEWLKTFERACPNLKKLIVYHNNKKNVMLEFLKDETHWPKLRRFDCDFPTELNIIRPFIYSRRSYQYKEEEKTPESFVRHWLFSDYK